MYGQSIEDISEAGIKDFINSGVRYAESHTDLFFTFNEVLLTVVLVFLFVQFFFLGAGFFFITMYIFIYTGNLKIGVVNHLFPTADEGTIVNKVH